MDANPLPFALVVETGLGVTGANSYISLADANTYHATGLYASAWTGANDDAKSRALGFATQAIDRTMIFRGYRKSRCQPLEFPRCEVPRRDLTESTFIGRLRRLQEYWPYNEVPYILANATAELAKELLKGDRTEDDPSKGIKQLGIGQGAVSITFDPSDRKIVFTDQVINLLRPLGSVRGARGNIRLVRAQ